MTTPVSHPNRRAIRTFVAAAIGMLPLIPELVFGLHLDGTEVGAQVVAVSGTMSRIMALPSVDRWIRRYLPWLAATPVDAP